MMLSCLQDAFELDEIPYELGEFLVELAELVGWPYLGKSLSELAEFFMEIAKLCGGHIKSCLEVFVLCSWELLGSWQTH